jgi:hypothetical protein
MIDEFDKDGDGEISENEFLAIMKQTSIYWVLKTVYVCAQIFILKLNKILIHFKVSLINFIIICCFLVMYR